MASAGGVQGVPKTLAEEMGIEPPGKFSFESCYKEVESQSLVFTSAEDFTVE